MKKLNKMMAGIMAVSLCMAGSAGFFPNGFISDISIKASAEIKESGTCGENVTYTLDDEGTFTISGTGNMTDYDYDTTPWYSERDSFKKVIIENGVTHISNWAFYYCTGLTSVTIPDSITSIGKFAFCGCSGLTSLTIPESVTDIREHAFFNCSGLTSIAIPNSVTSIEKDTFSDCSGLTSITIPDSVKSIGIRSFADCESLTSVTIPENITSIGNWAFFSCGNLKEITVLNPECEIDDEKYTISNSNDMFDGTIYGYKNSTAQAYAEKYNRKFVALDELTDLKLGDINGDGLIDAVDATAVRTEYAVLSAGKDSTLTDEQKKVADVNGDSLIDAVDATFISGYYAKVSAGENITFEEFVKNN